MQRGGFDVVLGNPPYGAEVDEGAREVIRLNQPMASGASNTGADFISLAFGIMAKGGAFGLVVPKSVTYSNAWKGVRNYAFPRLISTVDVGQAWPNVSLEMVLLFCAPQQLDAQDVPLQRGLDCPPISVPRALAIELDIIPTGLSDFDREILVKCQPWLSPNRPRVLSTVRGKGLQKFARDEGVLELLAGRNIAPFSLHGPWKYIDVSVAPDCEVIPPGSVVFQNIVAHLLNPSDHIRLIGTVTERPMIALDTVNIIKFSPQVSPYAVAAFLMSDFVSWFVYVAGFNRAVRTMHFDNYILEKLPQIPQSTLEILGSTLNSQGDGFTSRTWDEINDIVNSAYGLDHDIKNYLYSMHSRKGK